MVKIIMLDNSDGFKILIVQMCELRLSGCYNEKAKRNFIT